MLDIAGVWCFAYSSFSILMPSSRLKELLQTCFVSYLLLVFFANVVWSVVFYRKPTARRVSDGFLCSLKLSSGVIIPKAAKSFGHQERT